MQQCIQTFCKNLLKKSFATKVELLTLTKLTGREALTIKPLQAFTNNIEYHVRSIPNLNQTTALTPNLKKDISKLERYLNLYYANRGCYDAVFNPKKGVEVNAYSLYGIHEFFDNQTNDNTLDTEYNELKSICVLLDVYKDKFRGKHVEIQCENRSVIRMLNTYNAEISRPALQDEISKIAGICLEYQINPYWSETPRLSTSSDCRRMKQSL